MKTIMLLYAANPDVDKGAVTQRLTDHLIKLCNRRLQRDDELLFHIAGGDQHASLHLNQLRVAVAKIRL